MQGYRASRCMTNHKEVCGKRMNKVGWFQRGKVTKQITKSVERMMKKKLLREEIHAL